MKRKLFLISSSLTATVIIITLTLDIIAGEKKKNPELPEIKNVLVILADDHALHVTGVYGNSIIKTQTLTGLPVRALLLPKLIATLRFAVYRDSRC